MYVMLRVGCVQMKLIFADLEEKSVITSWSSIKYRKGEKEIELAVVSLAANSLLLNSKVA